MSMEEIVARAEQNIRNAIADYDRHTTKHTVLEDITNEFIHKLAEDSSYAKQGLRELFSKSPAWHPELDAIVINGNRTKEPDYDRAYAIACDIVDDKFCEFDLDNRWYQLRDAISWFCSSSEEQASDAGGLQAVKDLAPKAYAPGKKVSRAFRAFCNELGVADETAGSDFQRLFAMFADEINSKKIDFKLFVSINPAHFLTMSNPKEDVRGKCLTSCHSLNSTEYSYNNGCCGYARDEVSFIVFTVDDPNNPELLNNRKTSRQIFAYRPGSGLLLQSRMYNTSGGVYGAAEESSVYRDLIQREISDLEGANNLWTTGPSYSSKYEGYVCADIDFGGYQDWIYSEFDGHISIRSDADHPEPLCIGEAGLCVVCGGPINSNMYCDKHMPMPYHCDLCGEGCEEVYEVLNANGQWIRVCNNCLREHYVQCQYCGTWHLQSEIVVLNGQNLCRECHERYTRTCAICGTLHMKNQMVRVVIGDRVEWVCAEHASRFKVCPSCGMFHNHDDDTCPVCGYHAPTFTLTKREVSADERWTLAF